MDCIGLKIYKPLNDEKLTEYKEIAEWCNETQLATIEDRGEFYEVVAASVPTFADLKVRKRAEIAAARYDYEISGIIFKNVHVTTDREDQSMITAIALSATLNNDFTTVWKGTDGYIDLNAQEVLTLAYLVAEHVEAAFAEEKRLSELIDSAQTEEELNAIVWSL